MNLLKNQNKFEKKLQEQIGGMEIKPSDAHWEKLAQNLPPDNFEKIMLDKLENIRLDPYPETWTNIEQHLPLPRPVNKKYLYYSLLFFMLSVGVIAVYFMNTQKEINKIPPFENKENIVNKDQVKTILKSNENGRSGSSTSKVKNNEILKGQKMLAFNQGDHQKHIIPTVPLEKVLVNKKEEKTETLTVDDHIKLSNAVAEIDQAPLLSSKTENLKENKIENISAGDLIPIPAITSEKNKNSINNSLVISVEPLAQKTAEKKEDENKSMITIPKKDSLAILDNLPSVSERVNVSNYSSDKPSFFSFTSFAGTTLSFSRYVAPQNSYGSFDKNIALRKELETPVPDLSAGFILNYDVSKRFSISSGLVLTNFRQEFRYDTVAPQSQLNTVQQDAKYIHQQDSITNAKVQTADIKYSFTEIPVYVTYKAFHSRKFEIDIQGGFSYAFISGINAYIINQNNVGVMVLNGPDDFPKIKGTAFITLQPMFAYKMSDDVSIGIMPTYKSSLGSIIQNQYWVQQYPYFIGLHVFLRKKF